MNDLARIRIKTGLTRPGMLRLLGIRKGRLSLFQDGTEIDPILLERSHAIEAAYDEWAQGIRARLATAEAKMAARGDSTIPGSEASEALGLTEFNLSQLRVRGEVEGIQVGVKHWVYDIKALHRFLESNSTHLLDKNRKSGPLGRAFARYATKKLQTAAVAA